MTSIVPRTVTVVAGDTSRSEPLAEFRSAQAYVLLGDPGAGKTEAFRREHAAHADSEFLTARRFVRLSLRRVADMKRKTLFIDGLDEARVGSPDPRRPLDHILERLDYLGNPRFRLSCRAADWLGRNDLTEIVAEAGYQDTRVLHLDPLTDSDIRRMLTDQGVSEVRAFLIRARDHDLDGLLDNPQLLGLLAKATRDGEWPEDRSGIFELACRKLAREWNVQHRAVQQNSSPMSTDRIISAAGHLSALLLLSDRRRVSLNECGDSDCLHLQDVLNGDPHALRRAVKSNLFEGRPEGGFVSVHRQLSEFLAARFLGGRIEAGVPAGRVLALMTGVDGGAVTEMRGLSAWLAAFDGAARHSLVQRDPIGVALYGDVSRFRGHEIEHVLRAFADGSDEVRPWTWPSVALASLVSRHSIAVLERQLESDDRANDRQTVAGLLLHALSRARGAKARSTILERTVRDTTWNSWVRVSALRALLQHSGSDSTGKLLALLDDLRDGGVEDRDGELLGTLLKHFYPAQIGPDRIWDYMVPEGRSGPVGAYRLFWSAYLPSRSEGDDLAVLLRALAGRGKGWREQHLHDSDWMHRIVPKVVREALTAIGDQAAASTLCDWLELIGFGEAWSPHARTEAHRAVNAWVSKRPHLQKEIALEGLRRVVAVSDSNTGDGDRFSSPGDVDVDYRAWQIRRSIFSCGEPSDFSAWCLEQAVHAANTNIVLARILLEWSRPWGQDESDSGISTGEVRAATHDVPELRTEVALLVKGQHEQDARQHRMRVKEERSEYRAKRLREQEEFITYVRANLKRLSEGRCPPRLLHRIGEAYHDFFLDRSAATPRLRVLRLLQGHADLADAALQGFSRVVDRKDLPTLRDVIRLNEQKKISLHALPVLAGFDMMDGELLESRSPGEVARAAALYYLMPLNVEGHPPWYRWALQHRPKEVADALIKVTRSRVRRRLDCLHLWDLPRDDAHRAIARMTAVPLLRAFPTRCTEPQVNALLALLLAALKWEADGLAAFVETRISKPGLDVSQRALWLAAGLLLSPEVNVPRVAAFLKAGEEARSRQIVRLLAPHDLKPLPMPWGTIELRTMIELFGSRYSPWRPEGFGMASYVDEDRWRVEGLLSSWAATLGSRTDLEASEALRELCNSPELGPWHFMLATKRDEQAIARRDATFEVPDICAVQGTLANAEPANPADLAALVADRLEHLGKEIRHGNTDDWRQYWNEDPGTRRPIKPRHEESCRDALLSDLRRRLPDGVDAQPEAHYARDKRADIRVSCKGHAIPIEIKKSSHRRLWSAVNDQLVPKYSSAPESAGFGVYLVLWFGRRGMPVPPTGHRPETPADLRDRLQQEQVDGCRHKIHVVVLDVSR